MGGGNGALAREIIATNVITAMKDESYSMVSRWVDELLKDPELRKKIEYHTREIFKAIAEKL